jgi:cytochrome P450
VRRNLSHPFSDKALRGQKPLAQGYVDLLVSRLHEQVEKKEPIIDIMRWYNYTTFDVITILTFGELLCCIRDKDHHLWITMIFAMVRMGELAQAVKSVAAFLYMDKIKGFLVDKEALQRQRVTFFKWVSDKVTRRLERETQRLDFISNMVKNQEKGEFA